MATKVKVASVTFSCRWVSKRRAQASTWIFIEVRPMLSTSVKTSSTSPTRTGRMKVMASTAMVTTRPRARSTPAMPPAWSMRDSTQPPKISPLALVSAGIALMRTVSSPRGFSFMCIGLRCGILWRRTTE